MEMRRTFCGKSDLKRMFFSAVSLHGNVRNFLSETWSKNMDGVCLHGKMKTIHKNNNKTRRMKTNTLYSVEVMLVITTCITARLT